MENNPYSPPSAPIEATSDLAQGELASRLDRFWAALIDVIILMVLAMPIGFFMGLFGATKGCPLPALC